MEESNVRKYVIKETTLLEDDERRALQAEDSMSKDLAGQNSMCCLGRSNWSSMGDLGHQYRCS